MGDGAGPARLQVGLCCSVVDLKILLFSRLGKELSNCQADVELGCWEMGSFPGQTPKSLLSLRKGRCRIHRQFLLIKLQGAGPTTTPAGKWGTGEQGANAKRCSSSPGTWRLLRARTTAAPCF